MGRPCALLKMHSTEKIPGMHFLYPAGTDRPAALLLLQYPPFFPCVIGTS